MGASPRSGAAIHRFRAVCADRFIVLAALILALAAANLTVRVDREFLTDWDEALYTTSAWEMIHGGNWVATTFHDTLDYYNTKPPLNVWMIATSFKLFGASLWAARLPSIVCAWLTILALLVWARRICGDAVALWAGLILATSFGFLHVHAGRSANADAAFALVILLTAITLSAAISRPWRLLFLGPLAAAAFLLKGFGVLLPLTIVAAVMVSVWRRGQLRWRPLAGAAVGFLVPVSLWAFARWQVDGSEFFRRMLLNDGIGVTATVLDGHAGGVLFYLDALQKHEIDWLVAAVIAALTLSWREWRWRLTFWRADEHSWVVVGTFAVVCLVVPTAMRTKLPWYVNPFYPVFALLVGWLVAHALTASSGARRRRWCAAAFCAIALVAEARIGYYSFHYRDVAGHRQGLLLRETARLRGHRVYAADWAAADQFVLEAIVGARAATADGPASFAAVAAVDDYFVASALPDPLELRSMGCRGSACLYGRTPSLADADDLSEKKVAGNREAIE